MKDTIVDTAIGPLPQDSTGSAVAVSRLDPEKSYVNLAPLLQKHINESDQAAWEKIKSRIDYTYEYISAALDALEAETGFCREIKTRIMSGQKLFLKPNIVSGIYMNTVDHGPGPGATACTEWAFTAGVMRWFREKADINYHQMCLGEASTSVSNNAQIFSKARGRPVTPEAVMEGRSGDFYGGWPFYFVRRYLAENLPAGAMDDPMLGHEESVVGTYIPPGLAGDRLMVYDLNRVADDPNKGREVEVPDGENFKSIILHKAIVGGRPEDPEDRRAYPGCVLVNLAKLKVHTNALLTNAVKNLGIGLYPMQASRSGGCRWEYGLPFVPVPGVKGGLPHQVWVSEIDPGTGQPQRDEQGRIVTRKTGGLTAVMIDIIKAVQNQDIFLVNLVDAVETINLDHQGIGLGVKVPEGLVMAGLDPVALDLLSARYIFSNVDLEEARDAGLEDGHGGLFPQKVPLAVIKDGRIETGSGYDCPLARDIVFQKAEKRGLGRREYYVVGTGPGNEKIASVGGRLGTVDKGRFQALVTGSLYFALAKAPWDIQKTCFSYFEAVDKLEGSTYMAEFLAAFDETGNRVVSYEEFGRKGSLSQILFLGGILISRMADGESELMRTLFAQDSIMLKNYNPAWNIEGLDLHQESAYGSAAVQALIMSQNQAELPEAVHSGKTWGRGNWPGFKQAYQTMLDKRIFGPKFPKKIGLGGLYGFAFRYALGAMNGYRSQGPSAASNYFGKVIDGQAKPLDFTFYVPASLFGLAGQPPVPNVEITDRPELIWTARFGDGTVWPEIRPTDHCRE